MKTKKYFTIRVSDISDTLRRRCGDFGKFNEDELDSATEILRAAGWQKAPGRHSSRPALRPWRLEVGIVVYSAILTEIRQLSDVSELPRKSSD